jgi:hypothetical protein
MPIGGIFRSVLNPINLGQLAAGPAGWASLAMRAVVTNIAQSVIQRIGQQLGVPQPFINMAQQLAGDRMGNPFRQIGADGSLRSIAETFGMSSRTLGAIERSADSISRMLTDSILREMGDQANAVERRGRSRAEGAGEGGSRSFLMAIAEALGAAADDKMNQMYDLAQQIKDQTQSNTQFVEGLGSKPSNGDMLRAQNNQTKLGTLNSQFQAVSQELSILQNVISNSLKTIGEAQSTVARKN